MSQNCCGQSENQKEPITLTELEIAIQKVIAGKSVLEQLGITRMILKCMTPKELRNLYIMLVDATSAVTTQRVELDGIKTCCGSTDTDHINKPMNINIPGAGDCCYTND